MGYYESNLSLLVQREPELARKLEGAEMDLSFQSPIEKALFNPKTDLSRANTIVALGFGSGAHIKEVLSRIGRHNLVLVIDPDVGSFKRALSLADLRPVLSSGQISLSIGEEPDRATRRRLDEFYKINTISDIELIPYPPAIRRNEGYFKEILKHLKDMSNGAAQNRATLIEFASLWQENLLKNLPSMVRFPGVNALFGRFKGIPVVIVGAGPSLDRDLKGFNKIKGRALIIACDTALKTLLDSGIEPDLVVALDGGEENYKHFHGTNSSKTTLVAVSITHPKILSSFSGPIFMADFIHPLNEWLSLFVGEKGYLKTGGSVITTCFDLARLAGCDPIIFSGLDLAFTDGVTHSSGSSYTEGMLGGIGKFRTLEMMHRERIRSSQTLLIDGTNGKKVLTSNKHLTYLRWLESEIASTPGRLFINTTPAGARINGTSRMALSEVIGRFCRRIEVETILKEGQASYHPKSPIGLIQALERLLEEWESINSISSLGRNLSCRLVHLLEGGDGANGLFRELNPLYQRILRHQGFMQIARLNLEPLLLRMEEKGRGGGSLSRARAAEDFFSSIARYCQESLTQFRLAKRTLKEQCLG